MKVELFITFGLKAKIRNHEARPAFANENQLSEQQRFEASIQRELVPDDTEELESGCLTPRF